MALASDHPAAAYPTFLKVSRVPITVVVGPPGNGARAWIDARASDVDAVIDFAEIIEQVSGVPAHRAGAEWRIPALQRRNSWLVALADDPELTAAAWMISPAPFAWQREHWARLLGATIMLLDPGKEAALIGARSEGVEERFVHQWYSESAQSPRAAAVAVADRAPRPRSVSNRGYDRMNHGKARDAQLAREPHCRFCWEERQVRVRATVLDHIVPFRRADDSIDWKLWGDPKNHRSLCGPCHDARGATRSRPEKGPGAGVDGRPLDPAHPWAKHEVMTS